MVDALESEVQCSARCKKLSSLLGQSNKCIRSRSSLLLYYVGKIARSAIVVRISHRVGRVLSFLSSRRNWDFPNSSPAGECAPPRFWGRVTLAGERGVGRVPIPARGHTLWYSLYIYVLCGISDCFYS